MIAILRNVVGLLGGLVLGGLVNMGLIMLGPSIIPPPPGVDVTNSESIAASIHLFEAKHFIVPFVAHALGTLVGAIAAFFIAANYRPQIAYLVGAVFLVGGIWASTIIPAPTWFIGVDLVLAYLPMAWLGAKLAGLTLSGLGVQSVPTANDARQ